MSKLGCTCGHTIKDNTDEIPYEALCYADEDSPAYFEAIETVKDLLLAYEQATREHALLSPSDAHKASDGSNLALQITRILSNYHVGHLRDLFECENCGRLWLQVNPSENTYVSYLPEGQTRGVFRSHGGREEKSRLAVDKDSSGKIILKRVDKPS
jgi:hypothetical protein